MCKGKGGGSKGSDISIWRGHPQIKFPHGDITGRRRMFMCMGSKGGEGTIQSKKGTLGWYEGQRREGGFPWFTGHAWWETLRYEGVRAWVKWVVRVDQHEESCKWRRAVEAVR